jgi:hypothetical protein
MLCAVQLANWRNWHLRYGNTVSSIDLHGLGQVICSLFVQLNRQFVQQVVCSPVYKIFNSSFRKKIMMIICTLDLCSYCGAQLKYIYCVR